MIMNLAMPVSPYPTFPRTREKGQTNRYASFTLLDAVLSLRKQHSDKTMRIL